jgi:hypothetical protein
MCLRYGDDDDAVSGVVDEFTMRDVRTRMKDSMHERPTRAA